MEHPFKRVCRGNCNENYNLKKLWKKRAHYMNITIAFM